MIGIENNWMVRLRILFSFFSSLKGTVKEKMRGGLGWNPEEPD